jgi:hypothetical protein
VSEKHSSRRLAHTGTAWAAGMICWPSVGAHAQLFPSSAPHRQLCFQAQAMGLKQQQRYPPPPTLSNFSIAASSSVPTLMRQATCAMSYTLRPLRALDACSSDSSQHRYCTQQYRQQYSHETAGDTSQQLHSSLISWPYIVARIMAPTATTAPQIPFTCAPPPPHTPLTAGLRTKLTMYARMCQDITPDITRCNPPVAATASSQALRQVLNLACPSCGHTELMLGIWCTSVWNTSC